MSEPGFEERLARLQDAVKALESGDETLARSIEIYEGVVADLKACHGILDKAEQRVKILTEDDAGNLVEEDFAPPAE
jgi:exodeoxyribonuclease VII small subunit